MKRDGAMPQKSEDTAVNHLESNLALLSRRQPELARRLREASSQVEIFVSPSGMASARLSSVPLHSRYDPMKEARQMLRRQDASGADYFIFLGFGLGYLLDALLEEHADPLNRYFVVESDPGILRAAFEARDLASVLSLPHLHFAWPAAGPELAQQWRVFFDPLTARKSVFLTHSPSAALDPEGYKAAVEIIQSQTFQTFTDINTLVAKSREFLDNFVQNLPKAARAPGVAGFAGAFSRLPAVIVSAGPSLDKNIHEIRGWDDNVLILSTDTALKPLLAAGVEPHFVLTGDPSHLNYLHLKGASAETSLLVAETTSHPGAFDDFEGRTVACIFENSSLGSLSALLDAKGTLRAWGSVATMALDFALLVGCNPIIFVGQDLAHTDGRIYCSGLHFDDEWFAGVVDPEGWQARLKDLRAARRTVMVEDIFGKPTESTDKLTAYWNWILKALHERPEVRFVNATEGGILKGIDIMSLKEALYRYCSADLGLRSRVRDAFDKAARAGDNGRISTGPAMATLKGELAAIEDALDRGMQLCETGGGPQILKRLEATQTALCGNPHMSSLIDSFNQMGNVVFLRKRHSLQAQQSPEREQEIRSVYREYFRSVREALNPIGSALKSIEAALQPPVPERAIRGVKE